MPIITKLPQTKEEYQDFKRHNKSLNQDLGKLDVKAGKNSTIGEEPKIGPMVESLLLKNLKPQTQ